MRHFEIRRRARCYCDRRKQKGLPGIGILAPHSSQVPRSILRRLLLALDPTPMDLGAIAAIVKEDKALLQGVLDLSATMEEVMPADAVEQRIVAAGRSRLFGLASKC